MDNKRLISQSKSEFLKPEELPSSAVLLSIFKTLEQQFQERGFLPKLAKNVSPLWVFAEKERDNFLWRKGFSLASAGAYEFWIDIRELSKKRIAQLELSKEGFEVLHAGRASTAAKDDDVLADIREKEQAYVEALQEASAQIETHASALSHAGTILENEFSSDAQKGKIYVLLPAT